MFAGRVPPILTLDPPHQAGGSGGGGGGGGYSVLFDGNDHCELNGNLTLSANTTIIAVIRDRGTNTSYSPIVHYETDRGLAIVPTECKTGHPVTPTPCTNQSTRVVALDWSGSTDHGWHNLSGRLSVLSAAYEATSGSTTVNTCN